MTYILHISFLESPILDASFLESYCHNKIRL